MSETATSDEARLRPASHRLGDLLDEMAAVTPGAEALVFRDQRLDCAGLKAQADIFARALLAIGVKYGDRVALLVTNRPEWLIVAFAAAKIGAITAAISTFSTPHELAWALDNSGASVLITLESFCGRHFLDALRDLCPELRQSTPGDLGSARSPYLRSIVVIGDCAPNGVFAQPQFLARSTAVDMSILVAAQRKVRPEDICYILYTSGSTAAPKGVTLAHGPLIANGFDIGERMHLSAADCLWLAVPLFWSFGSVNAVPAIMTHGGCIVLQESFEAGEALALIEREGCSVYYGMANMARAMRNHPDHPGRRLGRMRTGLTIGPPEDIAMSIAALGVPELCNVYGSTETYGNCAVTDAHDPLPVRSHTQGRPLPGMTIRVVDPATRQAQPSGEVGELAVSGYVTPGYYRAPELDAAAFGREGQFLTGDLGSIEADGFIRFRGRLKEMIKTGGINVAPREVEEILLRHPASCRPMSSACPTRPKVRSSRRPSSCGPERQMILTPSSGSAASGWPATRFRPGLSFVPLTHFRARRLEDPQAGPHRRIGRNGRYQRSRQDLLTRLTRDRLQPPKTVGLWHRQLGAPCRPYPACARASG